VCKHFLQVSVNTIRVLIEDIYTVFLHYDMFRPFMGHHQVSISVLHKHLSRTQNHEQLNTREKRIHKGYTHPAHGHSSEPDSTVTTGTLIEINMSTYK
jgi:hypothetical protein